MAVDLGVGGYGVATPLFKLLVILAYWDQMLQPPPLVIQDSGSAPVIVLNRIVEFGRVRGER